MSGEIGVSTEGSSTLGHQVALARAYLNIFAVRMDGRLRIETDIPADLDAVAFPSLILATLAENAIRHGILPQDNGTIAIAAACHGGIVTVTLADDGIGFSSQQSDSEIGLNNIAERLRLLYGSGAQLHLGLNKMRGVRATIALPRTMAGVPLP